MNANRVTATIPLYFAVVLASVFAIVLVSDTSGFAASAAPPLLEVKLGERTVLRQAAIESAKLVEEEPSHAWNIVLQFAPSSTKEFHRVTKMNVGKSLHVRVEGKLAVSALIQGPIVGGRLFLPGRYTKPEAERIAALLTAPGAQKNTAVKRPPRRPQSTSSISTGQ